MLLRRVLFAVPLTALALGGVLPMRAQAPIAEGPVPTTLLINAESKDGTPPDAARMTLQVEGRPVPITTLMQVKPSTAQVAILIDDGLRASFGNQLSDLADFNHAAAARNGRPGRLYAQRRGGRQRRFFDRP